MKQSLKSLFATLDARQDPIPLAELEAQVRQTELVNGDFQHVVLFGDKTYRRNLLHEGPAYHALVICWRAGQRSVIHDHSGSSCAVLVLDGVATETEFAMTAHGLVYATGTRDHHPGAVFGSYDGDAHQISNLQAPQQGLITLHVYSPPLVRMSRFSLTESQVESFVDPIELFVQGAGI